MVYNSEIAETLKVPCPSCSSKIDLSHSISGCSGEVAYFYKCTTCSWNNSEAHPIHMLGLGLIVLVIPALFLYMMFMLTKGADLVSAGIAFLGLSATFLFVHWTKIRYSPWNKSKRGPNKDRELDATKFMQPDQYLSPYAQRLIKMFDDAVK